MKLQDQVCTMQQGRRLIELGIEPISIFSHRTKTRAMTPQQKAKELVYTFYDKVTKHAMAESEWLYARQSAIICVDEIIKADPNLPYRSNMDIKIPTAKDYWQQVKEELQKL